MEPRFLLIDDQPGAFGEELLEHFGKKHVRLLLWPADFVGEDSLSKSALSRLIEGAEVLLIDHKLDDETRQRSPFEPRTGGALVASLLSYAESKKSDQLLKASQLRIIVTSQIDLLKGADKLPITEREHITSVQHGFDWIYAKLPEQRLPQQKSIQILEQLPTAVRAARKLEGSGLPTRDVIGKLMALSATSWSDQALADIESQHPPLQAIGNRQPLSFVRWLLHVGLPFPGSLLELRDVCLALRIDPKWVRDSQRHTEALMKSLMAYAYTGQLKTFLGPRFWRAGISHHIWKKAQNAPHEIGRLKTVAAEALKLRESDVKFIDTADPVLVVDEDFRRTDDVLDVELAVQIQPDDWPAAVESPWISIKKVKGTKRLKALVVPKDTARV